MSASRRSTPTGKLDRRAALRRPVHVERLQPPARATSRCCAARSTTSWRAPACRPPAMTARRWRTSSTPIRATSCSRFPRTNCSPPRSASCGSASGRRCACSCASTASTVSSPRSSSCRATATTRRAREKHPRNPRRRLQRPHVGRDADARRHARWRACTTSSAATKARGRMSTCARSKTRSAPRSAPGTTASPTRSTAVHGETEGMRLLQERQAHFSPGYRGVVLAGRSGARSRRDRRRSPRADERAARCSARVYRKRDDAHNALRLKLYLLGEVMPLSASLPIFENLGLKVIAEDSFAVSLQDRRRLDARCVRARFPDGARRRRRRRARRHQGAAGRRLPRRRLGRGGERRLQPARASAPAWPGAT